MHRPPNLFLCAVLVLAATVLCDGLLARRTPQPLAVPLNSISREIAGWTAMSTLTLDEQSRKVLRATSYLGRTYRKRGGTLDLFLAFYAMQRAGESMHSPKDCIPGAGWEISRTGSADVPLLGQSISVNAYSIQNLGTKMLVLYWYQSPDRIVANEYVGKVLLARDTLLTGHTSGSIVRLILPDAANSLGEGIAFASELMPEVQRCFSGYPQTLRR